MRSGNLKIELKFGTAIAGGPYTLIMYGLSDSYSEIDSFNNVNNNNTIYLKWVIYNN